MADKRFSDLTVATSIADTDLLAISQSGVSKQALGSVLKAFITGGSVTLGGASTDTLTLNSGTVTLNNSTTISAASTKTLTLNGGAGSNGLVLDANNNVGIGTVPTNWASAYGQKAINVGPVGSISSFDAGSGNIQTFFSLNSYNNGINSAYMQTAAAAAYKMGRNTHSWLIAPSGTAGNTISFTTAMTLDGSGNLGIGPTSFSYPLSLYRGAGVSCYAEFIGNAQAASSLLIGQDASGLSRIFQLGANPITFWTNSLERMRLDAAGHLGLGVTPSAWGSSTKALQLSSGSLATNGTNYLDLLQNVYDDGTAKRYVNTGYASQYRQTSGTHTWYTAASGTAGNAITFTQAMTLDASGNLLVGTTNTATAKVTVSSSVGSQWGIDLGTNSTISVASGANAIIAVSGTGSQGSGLIIITDTTATGSTAAYLIGGSTPVFLGGSGTTPFVSPTTTPAAGKVCIANDGTSAIRIYNNYGSTITFGLGMIKTRNSL